MTPPEPVRLVPDRSLRILDDGHVLIGGSPLTVLRVSRPLDPTRVASPVLADRLIDTGMAHPDPATGPFGVGDLTVVVPVYDDPDGLAVTLDGCAATLPTSVRIIVVDDAGTDPASIVAVSADRPGVESIRRTRNGGPAAARNTGWRAATTPVVAFIDAGCVPEPGWTAPLTVAFADARVALAAPRIRADPARPHDDRTGRTHRERLGVVTRITGFIRDRIGWYERTRSSLDLGREPGRISPGTRISYVPSACIVVRRDVLADVGGFDESLRVGEDVDLVWRLAARHRLRYLPAATVSHDVRTRPWSWLRRRCAYGTSAAPLAVRHPSGPVPVRVSAWSAAVWAAVAVGRPTVGATIAAASTGLLARKLADLDHPVRVACRLAGVGNLTAGELLANAVRRAWWPVALPLAVFGPRPVRRAVAAAFIVPPLVAWRPATGLDPISWILVSTADDLAYGAGVWAGCLRSRTVAPLLPDFGVGRIPPP